MSTVTVSITYNWHPVGLIQIDEASRLIFPKVPEVPGLYRFHFERGPETHTYIGETDRLRRRLQHYRTPGPTQSTNIRVGNLLLEVIALGIPVWLSVVTPPVDIEVARVRRHVDLARKSDRVLVEHAAIHAARSEGTAVLNL